MKNLARSGGNITGAITLPELIWANIAMVVSDFVPASPAIGFMNSALVLLYDNLV